MEKTFVKSCGDCPMFHMDDAHWDYCSHPDVEGKAQVEDLRRVPNFCPLLTQPIAIFLDIGE